MDKGELAKSFALGILTILVTLIAIEAISVVAPSIYGDVEKTVQQWGTTGVFVGVLIGSTALPFPTDLFFVTAVKLADTTESKFTMMLVATVAGFLGAVFNYWLARLFSEKLVYKFISEEQLESAKQWFDKYGPFPILFFGVIPSSPVFDPITFVAGLTRMDFKQFALYSFVSRFLHFALLALIASRIAI